MDKVYSTSIFGKAAMCGMEMENYDESPDDCYLSNEDCCRNENQKIDGSIPKKEKEIRLNLIHTYFLTSFSVSKYFLIDPNLNIYNLYKDYPPPKVIKNISVLFQVFII